MPTYVVYRHGLNPATQGLPEKMPVARLEAGSPEEACRLAAKQVPVAPGQSLSAELAEVVDARENNLNLKAEALEE
jgi:hypothetical protein